MKFLQKHYLWLLLLALLPVTRNRVEPNLRGVIWSDAEGYYVYLPAVFNLHDVHKVPPGSMNARTNEAGETVIKYTCGVALFQLPLFLVAKVWSDTHGFPTDDIYNANYARAVALTGYLVGFLGLFFLQRVLRQRGYGEGTVALTLLATFGGTNLFYYATKQMGMSHVYSFALFAFLVWHLPRFFSKPDWRNAALLGGALGWIVLIRPTNVVALLLVLLFDVYTWRDLTARLRWLWEQKAALGVATVAGFVFLMPQLWYWHEMTGHWVRYSYEGEGFPFWNRPKIAAVLFDPQNGLFLYSPLVLLAVVGMLVGWVHKRWHGPALTLIFGLSTYIFASWWAWWFGGAFGHRSYVELYALFALPMAGMLDILLRQPRPAVRWAGVLGVLFLIFYSVKLSYLYHELPGPWDGPDWRWNWDKMVWIWSHLFKF